MAIKKQDELNNCFTLFVSASVFYAQCFISTAKCLKNSCLSSVIFLDVSCSMAKEIFM